MADVQTISKLAIDDGTRKVEVNDRGDTITLRTADTTFQTRLVELSAWAQSQKDNYADLQARLSECRGDLDQFLVILKQINAIPDEAAGKVDALFGDGACIKIFGTETPDILLVLEFLEQIIPIYGEAMTDRANARSAELKSKYNRDRRGNV